MSFQSIQSILDLSIKNNQELWEVVLEDDLIESAMTKEQSLEQMNNLWQAMQNANDSYDPCQKSMSGLVGTDGGKMEKFNQEHKTIGGDFLGEVIAHALKMGECNACMKRIVAAPTAGSCGVLPAIFIPLAKLENIPDSEIVKALYVSAGFGQVIAQRASISGAEGGCQAEVGSASAMGAAALVSLRGGTAQMCANACAMALKNLLGLVCDPVAGLVEVPCVKRNVVGAVNAISSANMALAGIESKIPVDEVIDAMQSISAILPNSLKETGEGGLAATPTGIDTANNLNKK